MLHFFLWLLTGYVNNTWSFLSFDFLCKLKQVKDLMSTRCLINMRVGFFGNWLYNLLLKVMYDRPPKNQTLQLSYGFLWSSPVHLIQNILHSTTKFAFTLLGSRDYLVHTQKFPVFINITHCQIPEAQLRVHEVKPLHFLYTTRLLFSQITAAPDSWYIMKVYKSRLQYSSSHLTLGTWAVTCPLTAGLLRAAGVGSVMSHVPQSACKKT